ncbi:MAG TPA: M2 family metallopeptidase, partial [bacterium]|nr:M2 family metallopeptidase [bacterium]
MKALSFCLLAVALLFSASAEAKAGGKDSAMLEKEATAVVEEYLSKYEPMDLELRKAWFEYNTTGNKKASEREAELMLMIRKLDSDRDRFARIKGLFKEKKKIADPLVRRQVEVLYQSHLPNQVSKEKLETLTKLEKNLDVAFNDYRPEVDGKKLDLVEISHILADSTDSAELEKAWKAQHLVAPLLERDYRELVKLRNDIARDLGYNNALELQAEVAETDLKMLDRFYSEVTKATEKPFKKLKEEYVDPRLAKRYGIKVSELKPWHYQNAFFQEAPTAIFGDVDLDELYANSDSNGVIKQTRDLYASMGVDVSKILANSSLFPKPGKNQHACAWYLDPNRPGSSILIMSLPRPPKSPKASEASTLVHELGHDINYEAILANKEIPYLLRDATMLTEAFAMLMEQQTQTVDWFVRLGVEEKKAREAADTVALIDYVNQLMFLRWSAAIYCFEKRMYADPDADIGALWWECREKNQMLARPKGWENPDALAKYHIPNVSPLYYSNYAIGQVANVQFAELFGKRIGDESPGASYFGKRELGDWLMGDFLAQGEKYRWDEFLKMSTGKPLSVSSWTKRYVGSPAE